MGLNQTEYRRVPALFSLRLKELKAEVLTSGPWRLGKESRRKESASTCQFSHQRRSYQDDPHHRFRWRPRLGYEKSRNLNKEPAVTRGTARKPDVETPLSKTRGLMRDA
jgi:hypothetical protein